VGDLKPRLPAISHSYKFKMEMRKIMWGLNLFYLIETQFLKWIWIIETLLKIKSINFQKIIACFYSKSMISKDTSLHVHMLFDLTLVTPHSHGQRPS
jgi:hypothetical protein